AVLRRALVEETAARDHDKELADLFFEGEIGRGAGRDAAGGEADDQQDAEKGAHWRDSLKWNGNPAADVFFRRGRHDRLDFPLRPRTFRCRRGARGVAPAIARRA